MAWDLDVAGTFKERAERLLEIQKDPVKLAALEKYYETRPAEFINDWGCTIDPRLDTPLVPFVLFPKQIQFVNWLHNSFKNRQSGQVEKSRDAGATWLCGAFSVWAIKYHSNINISFGSRKSELVDKSGDPKCIFEKIRAFIYNLPDILRPDIESDSLMKIAASNGSTITGEGGDQIGRGGRSRIYFVDEAAFIERPEKVDAALSMNTDIRIEVSTPNGTGNPFYRKVHGGQLPVFVFDWRDDPRKDEDWYRKFCRENDPIVVAQEVDRDYNASVADNLIDGKAVAEAMNRTVDFEIFGPKIVSCDAARFGDDRTVIGLRQGRILHWIDVHQNISTTQIVGILVNIIEECSPDAVFIDTVGLGAGVYDQLLEKYDANLIRSVEGGRRAKEYKKYRDVNAECWAKMRDWFNSEVVIPNIDGLESEFSSRKYSFDSDGRLVLEKKSDMKKRGVRSPDIADMLALTFADDVEYYNPFDEDDYAPPGSGRWY